MNKTKIPWVQNPDGSQETGLVIKPVEDAYLAGFFDGEGSAMILTIRRMDGENIFYRFRPVIKIHQKTEDILLQIMNTLGYGHIDSSKDGYAYIVNGANGVLRFCQRVLPHSFIKNDALTAVAGLAFLQKCNHRNNNPYSRRMFEEMLNCREKVFEANSITRSGLRQKYPTDIVLAEHHFVDDVDAWQKNRMRGIRP